MRDSPDDSPRGCVPRHASSSMLPRLSAGRVRFSGRLRGRGVPVPRGLVVVLQGREGGKWRTFSDARTHKKGHWHIAYHFSGRPGSYPIRLRIRRQVGFPFELGYSPRLTIRVG